jgi:hypothetical protein
MFFLLIFVLHDAKAKLPFSMKQYFNQNLSLRMRGLIAYLFPLSHTVQVALLQYGTDICWAIPLLEKAS